MTYQNTTTAVKVAYSNEFEGVETDLVRLVDGARPPYPIFVTGTPKLHQFALGHLLMIRAPDLWNVMKAQRGLTVLMAEQNFAQALRIADRGYVIVHGKIAFAGDSAAELNDNALIRKFYMGL